MRRVTAALAGALTLAGCQAAGPASGTYLGTPEAVVLWERAGCPPKYILAIGTNPALSWTPGEMGAAPEVPAWEFHEVGISESAAGGIKAEMATSKRSGTTLLLGVNYLSVPPGTDIGFCGVTDELVSYTVVRR